MTETALLAGALDQLMNRFERDATEAAIAFDDQLWARLDEAGFCRIGVDVNMGGSGGSASDKLVLLERLGAAAASVPVAETIGAGQLCQRARLHLPLGKATLSAGLDAHSLRLTRRDNQWHLNGTIERVPYGRVCDWLIATVRADGQAMVVIAALEDCEVYPGTNLAREPRDRIVCSNLQVEAASVEEDWIDPALIYGGMVRSAALVGVLGTIVKLTQQHVEERVQFGKQLRQFAAVTDQVADMVSELASALTAVYTVMELTDREASPIEVAAMKIRVAQAATRIAEHGHHLHGATGFTDEHRLHLFTTRAWSWRDEFGSQAWWERTFGRFLVTSGPDALWPQVVGAGFRTNDTLESRGPVTLTQKSGYG